MAAVDRRSVLIGAAGVAGSIAARSPAMVSTGPVLPRAVPPPATGLRLDPRAFGAVGDGAAKDTLAIQLALDRCAVFGGGEVVLANGRFLVGALRIGSNTCLRVLADAAILGSPDLADYPLTQVRWEGRWISGHAALIRAEDAARVSLAGGGRIVASPAIPGRVAPTGLRNPALMEFTNVRGLSVTGLRTEANDMWSIHPVDCEDATFADLLVAGGADGIDVDSCRRVLIARCFFDTGDDCVSLKSGRGLEAALIARPCEDVTIRDCTMRDRHWACIGIGSETSGGIRRVLVERCRFLAARTFSLYIKSRPGRGAFIEDITIRDGNASGAGQGFLRVNLLDSGKQDQFPVPGQDGIPSVRDIRIERMRVDDAPVLVEATNIHPDKPLDGFTLADIQGTADRGISLANMRRARIERITVAVRQGPMLATANVSGTGLGGAVPLVPPPRPAPVVAADPPYRPGLASARPN